jgi:hypothetical protein
VELSATLRGFPPDPSPTQVVNVLSTSEAATRPATAFTAALTGPTTFPTACNRPSNPTATPPLCCPVPHTHGRRSIKRRLSTPRPRTGEGLYLYASPLSVVGVLQPAAAGYHLFASGQPRRCLFDLPAVDFATRRLLPLRIALPTNYCRLAWNRRCRRGFRRQDPGSFPPSLVG